MQSYQYRFSSPMFFPAVYRVDALFDIDQDQGWRSTRISVESYVSTASHHITDHVMLEAFRCLLKPASFSVAANDG